MLPALKLQNDAHQSIELVLIKSSPMFSMALNSADK